MNKLQELEFKLTFWTALKAEIDRWIKELRDKNDNFRYSLAACDYLPQTFGEIKWEIKCEKERDIYDYIYSKYENGRCYFPYQNPYRYKQYKKEDCKFTKWGSCDWFYQVDINENYYDKISS